MKDLKRSGTRAAVVRTSLLLGIVVGVALTFGAIIFGWPILRATIIVPLGVVLGFLSNFYFARRRGKRNGVWTS